MSIPFRTSGLVPGAKLELVLKSNTPSAIQVGLQVPLPEGKEIPGGRLIQKFPSNLSLWQVLRQFESGKASNGRNINITARGVAQTVGGGTGGSGQLYYETPVLNIMGREFSTFTDFQKTLSQLGYNSGSVLIRLSYKLSGQTLFEAMEEIGRYFKEEGSDNQTPPKASADVEQAAQQEDGPTGDVSMDDAPPPVPPTNTHQNEEDGPAEPTRESASINQSSATSQEAAAGSKDPLQPVNVYLAPTGTVPAAALAPLEENDYTPTIAHAQLHQSRLQESSRNKRLLSDKELSDKAAAEEAKLSAVKSVLVKVRFPDNTSSEWNVGPSEKGSFLYEAVRHVMASPDQPFHLVLPGDKTVIRDSSDPAHSLIRGYKMSARVLVNLVWEDSVPADIRKRPFLQSDVAQQGQAVKLPDIPQQVEEKTPSSSRPQEQTKPEKSGDGTGKKIPKWLKLGKK